MTSIVDGFCSEKHIYFCYPKLEPTYQHHQLLCYTDLLYCCNTLTLIPFCLSGSRSSKDLLKLFICSYGYLLFCFINSNNLILHSCNKYLKIITRQVFKQHVQNRIYNLHAKFLLIVKPMYFSNPFGITSVFT